MRRSDLDAECVPILKISDSNALIEKTDRNGDLRLIDGLFALIGDSAFSDAFHKRCSLLLQNSNASTGEEDDGRGLFGLKVDSFVQLFSDALMSRNVDAGNTIPATDAVTFSTTRSSLGIKHNLQCHLFALFFVMDVNKDGLVSWEDFIDYVIDALSSNSNVSGSEAAQPQNVVATRFDDLGAMASIGGQKPFSIIESVGYRYNPSTWSSERDEHTPLPTLERHIFNKANARNLPRSQLKYKLRGHASPSSPYTTRDVAVPFYSPVQTPALRFLRAVPHAERFIGITHESNVICFNNQLEVVAALKPPATLANFHVPSSSSFSEDPRPILADMTRQGLIITAHDLRVVKVWSNQKTHPHPMALPQLYEYKCGDQITSLLAGAFENRSLASDRSGGGIAFTGESKGGIKVWDLRQSIIDEFATGESVSALRRLHCDYYCAGDRHADAVTALHADPIAYPNSLISGDVSGVMCLHDIERQVLLRAYFQACGGILALASCCVSGGGGGGGNNLIVSTSFGPDPCLWDLSSRQSSPIVLKDAVRPHLGRVPHILVVGGNSLDGENSFSQPLVVTCDVRSRCKVWDIRMLRCLDTIDLCSPSSASAPVAEGSSSSSLDSPSRHQSSRRTDPQTQPPKPFEAEIDLVTAAASFWAPQQRMAFVTPNRLVIVDSSANVCPLKSSPSSPPSGGIAFDGLGSSDIITCHADTVVRWDGVRGTVKRSFPIALTPLSKCARNPCVRRRLAGLGGALAEFFTCMAPSAVTQSIAARSSEIEMGGGRQQLYFLGTSLGRVVLLKASLDGVLVDFGLAVCGGGGRSRGALGREMGVRALVACKSRGRGEAGVEVVVSLGFCGTVCFCVPSRLASRHHHSAHLMTPDGSEASSAFKLVALTTATAGGEKDGGCAECMCVVDEGRGGLVADPIIVVGLRDGTLACLSPSGLAASGSAAIAGVIPVTHRSGAVLTDVMALGVGGFVAVVTSDGMLLLVSVVEMVVVRKMAVHPRGSPLRRVRSALAIVRAGEGGPTARAHSCLFGSRCLASPVKVAPTQTPTPPRAVNSMTRTPTTTLSAYLDGMGGRGESDNRHDDNLDARVRPASVGHRTDNAHHCAKRELKRASLSQTSLSESRLRGVSQSLLPPAAPLSPSTLSPRFEVNIMVADDFGSVFMLRFDPLPMLLRTIAPRDGVVANASPSVPTSSEIFEPVGRATASVYDNAMVRSNNNAAPFDDALQCCVEINNDGHAEGIDTIAARADGLYFATASLDGVVKLWRVNSDAMGRGEEDGASPPPPPQPLVPKTPAAVDDGGDELSERHAELVVPCGMLCHGRRGGRGGGVQGGGSLLRGKPFGGHVGPRGTSRLPPYCVKEAFSPSSNDAAPPRHHHLGGGGTACFSSWQRSAAVLRNVHRFVYRMLTALRRRKGSKGGAMHERFIAPPPAPLISRPTPPPQPSPPTPQPGKEEWQPLSALCREEEDKQQKDLRHEEEAGGRGGDGISHTNIHDSSCDDIPSPIGASKELVPKPPSQLLQNCAFSSSPEAAAMPKTNLLATSYSSSPLSPSMKRGDASTTHAAVGSKFRVSLGRQNRKTETSTHLLDAPIRDFVKRSPAKGYEN